MQLKYHMVTIEDLVPEDHFLRELERTLDLSFVYEESAHLYSRKYGRPPIDPVVMVKYLLLGFLYGIPSERQIEQRCADSNAFRWYLGIDLDERVPDHSTISQLRRRKPTFRKVFRRLFEEVVGQCIEKGMVSGRLVATDSTHVKANASRSLEYLKEMPEEPGLYWERLDQYEEDGLKELERRTGKRRKKRTKQIKKDSRRTQKRMSRTDPEAGYLKRRNKPLGMHYLSHQTLDTDCGVILDVAVTAGDSSDLAPYLPQMERVRSITAIQAAAADSSYDSALVQHELGLADIAFYTVARKTPDNAKMEFGTDAFSYEEDDDVYRCPNGKTLALRTLYRSSNGLYWVYRAELSDCRQCIMRGSCLCDSHQEQGRRILRNYFEAAVQSGRKRRNSPEYLQALRLRQIWCEGSFAAQKRSHNLTRVLRKGLEAAEDHCLLSAVALNLKRMIKYVV